MTEYLPEGSLFNTAENRSCIASLHTLGDSLSAGKVLEAPCIVCTGRHDLIVDLGCMRGVIPRKEGAIGIAEGTTKDIALISRVNKPVSFIVTGFDRDEHGEMFALLSRKAAQLKCMESYLGRLSPGDIIPARVTHLEPFGCFVDIGCGIPSLIPIDMISVSRITHPKDRFRIGQNIFAVVKSRENGRICLTHKELLGTWAENAALFEAGETVTGIVRSIEDYGIFVELTPNLAGLAELHPNVAVNSRASVYIKAIIPEKMKIKLIIVSTSDDIYQGAISACNNELKYFKTSGHIDSWLYSGDNRVKVIRTEFE